MADALEAIQRAFADRYAIQRELGRGGMATVYLAEDRKHHRLVAIKVLKPELAVALGPERFLREIELTGQLRHPNILPLYDSGRVGAELLYYVMPYVEGESLRQQLAREKQLSLADALQITRDVAEALSYAHSRGVIHRDIKPENILLESGRAVVADFGIAKAVTAAGGERLTETGLAIGTPAYMSPEQAAGTADLDPRSDLYSLASVLYEMLAGEPPYSAPTAQALVAKKLSEPTPRISVVREAVPPPVERIIERALAKTPADRPRTAAAFADELTAAAARDVEVRGSVTAPRRPRFKTLAVLGVGTAVLLAVGVAVLPDRAASGVAVLPVDNLSQDPDHAAFAAGLHDEMITRLWQAGVRVPSRSSMLQYGTERPSARDIAARHNVSHLLEMTVRWGADTIRIRAMLVDAQRDEPVWTHQDARLRSARGLLATQNEIARRVAAALSVQLTPAADRRLAERPTDNTEAYEFYLGGKALRTGAPDDLREAEALFARAVDADPQFAEAWAELGRTRLAMIVHGLTERPIALAKEAIDRAVALGPDRPVTRFAVRYYEGTTTGDLDRVAADIERLMREQPSNAEAIGVLAEIRRDQGRWRESIDLSQTLLELDPSARVLFDLGFKHLCLQEYAEADDYFERAIPRDAGWAWPLLGRVYLALMRDGDVDAARAGLRRMFQRLPAWEVLYEFGKISLPQHAPYRRILLPDLEPALRDSATAAALRDQCARCLWLLRADAAGRRGDTVVSRAYHDSVIAASRAVAVDDQPGPLRWQTPLVLAGSYAWRGDSALAVTAARRAAALMPPTRNAYAGAQVLLALAEVYWLVGETDAALATLERFLSYPSVVSRDVIGVDPLWVPLHTDPRFQRLIGAARE